MTNHEYILNKLASMNERQLTELIESNTFRNKVKDAQDKWAENIPRHNKGNQYTPESNDHPAYYRFQMWYNKITNKWEKKGRTALVNIQQFLSAQFDESYWK